MGLQCHFGLEIFARKIFVNKTPTMKKQLLFLFFSMSSFLPVFSQIQGRVIDANNQPIEFANVALYALPDSVLVTGTITDKNGEFSLTANDIGKAFLKISFIG